MSLRFLKKVSNLRLLKEAASRFGTPCYIYSEKILKDNVSAYKECFRGVDILFCYALKANSNPHILKIMADKGLGADVVSGGELLQALSCGFDSKRIIFSGVGKTKEELLLAIEKKILFVNVESFEELKVLGELALSVKKRVNFSVRINPNVDPHTHKYISTGKYGSKFGVPAKEALEMYFWSLKNPFLTPIGIHFHLGSQIFDARAYGLAFSRILKILEKLENKGILLKIVDIGGGWGVEEGEPLIPPFKIAEIISKYKGKYSFIMEPGRSLVASCGFFIAKTLYRKKSGARQIVIVDGGMNDFIRPSLYGARHPVINISKNGCKRGRAESAVDIYGPVCESGDFLAKDVNLKVPDRGDLLCFLSAGAYGYSMSSNYNLRLRPAEVIISGKKAILVGARQKYSDIVRKAGK